MKSYLQDILSLEKQFNTNIQTGLSGDVALKLYQARTKYKPATGQRSFFLTFLSQFQDPLIYILLVASALIFLLGEYLDAFIICGILIFNATIGTVQEKKTSGILEKLHSFTSAETVVIRDGNKQIISHELLVPGDIIVLQSGEKVPADARIILAEHATVNESMFTGESYPVAKQSSTLSEEDAPLHRQSNMIFQGTYLITGKIRALVTAVGKDSETGQLHETIHTIQTNIPLKKEVEKISWIVLTAALALCGSLLCIGLLTGKSLTELLIMLTALFICVVPEGLPVVMTLIMISGAHRMAKKKVIVSHLQSIEALGRVDTIIIDKTGTLTKNELMVQKIFIDETVLQVSGSGYSVAGEIENSFNHQASILALSTALELLQNAHIEHDDTGQAKIKGSATEASLKIFSLKSGCFPSLETYRSLDTIPFDSDRKYQAKLYLHEEKTVVFSMGAPEKIFQICTNVSPLAKKFVEDLSLQGYRIIAVAQKTSPELVNLHDASDLENSFCIGMLAIQDTIRDDVAAVIKQTKQNGIKVVMATGDHEKTARYIAHTVGIYSKNDLVMTGEEFKAISDAEAVKKLQQVTVCARFSPHDKLRLVNIYHQQKKIVAMAGDGINDIPALVAADISIAMGTASDITQQASDIILLENSFNNIMYAIQEGRSMFLALRRTILYFLTSNTGEVLIVFFSLLLSLPMPMLAAQILWLNLITDGFLDAALSMEPVHTGQTEQNTPLPKTLVDRSVLYKTLYLSIPMSVISLAVFLYYYQTDLALARTLTLLIMAMFQWFNAWNCRSEKQSIFTIGLLSNRWLIWATLTVFLLQTAVIYVPFMQIIFRTTSLGLHHWGIAIGLSSLILVVEETKKYFVRKFS
jgi:Ca2+-transporting ATPase